MAEVLLFHHAQGQTAGFHTFAHELRQASHTVHTPDLFDGRTFGSIEEGMAYAEQIGFPAAIIERGERADNELPAELVYAGFSLGVVPAQKLAQTRPGARGALFFYSCVPLPEFGGSWPAGVPVQIHGMDSGPAVRLHRHGRGRQPGFDPTHVAHDRLRRHHPADRRGLGHRRLGVELRGHVLQPRSDTADH
jgi:hypothetical protein